MRKLVNSFFGYRDPKPNEDYTDVIFTKDEYEKDVVDRIENLQNEIRNLKKEHEKKIEDNKNAANKKIADVKSQAEKQVNEAKTEAEEYKGRANSFENINKNLIRIATERANAKRGLTPKKEHIGYLFLNVEQISYKFGKEEFLCYRVRLQSPYEINFDETSAKDLILNDFVNKFGINIGIAAWYANNYFNVSNDETKKIWNGKDNFIFKAFYKANFIKGFWEVEYLVRFAVNIIPEMMAKI